MNKDRKYFLTLYAIVFAVFFLLFFIIPFARTTAVMVMFLFGLLSVVLGCFVTYYAFNGTQTVRSKVYGFPVFKIGLVYMGAQITLTVVFGIINRFRVTPVWLSAAISILLLAAALIGVIATDGARDIIESIEEKAGAKTEQMKRFKLDIASLADGCADAEAKKLLNDLSDKLKYSDPISSPALADIEWRIVNGIEEIKGLLGGGDGLAEKIKEVSALVDERNRRCKAEK